MTRDRLVFEQSPCAAFSVMVCGLFRCVPFSLSVPSALNCRKTAIMCNRPKPSGWQLAEIFFTKQEGSDIWKCRCGKKTQTVKQELEKPSLTYPNCTQWTREIDAVYKQLAKLRKLCLQLRGGLELLWEAWLYYLRFQTVFRCQEQCSEQSYTLQTDFPVYIFSLSAPAHALVEQKLSKPLLKQLDFDFDGWTAWTTNDVGVFASFAT